MDMGSIDPRSPLDSSACPWERGACTNATSPLSATVQNYFTRILLGRRSRPRFFALSY
jgi:hypothetical protein